ncbi:MAG: hypothetical protein FJ311_10070 [Rhodospirillales bacterium]|nr:hypothetical protein [Rhodospirillales bacterium]
MSAPENSWPWMVPPELGVADADGDTLARAVARVFSGADGERFARYLRAITLDRALGPDAPVARLRHLEGQRQLVRHLLALAERGRA